MTETTTSQPQHKLLRLTTYLASARLKQVENWKKYPCLGLNFEFGDKEISRLQNAIARHNRQDQFENLTVPVDILLRMLSFVPNERDPRIAEQYKQKCLEADEKSFLVNKTLQRLSATCSTLLFTINENRCILGSSEVPENCGQRAKKIEENFRREQKLKEREEAKKLKVQEQEEKEREKKKKLEEEKEKAKTAATTSSSSSSTTTRSNHHQLHTIQTQDEALDTISSAVSEISRGLINIDISQQLNHARNLIESIEDLDLDLEETSLRFCRKKKKSSSDGGNALGGWGKKKKKDDK